MTLALKACTTDDVWRDLAQRFGAPSDREALLRALIAEHIRSLLFASAVREAEFRVAQRAHTMRLTGSVRRNLASLSPDVLLSAEDDDVVGATLDAMATMGDVMNTGGGFRLAAPFRLVSCEESEDRLALGGVAREPLELHIGSPLILAGVSRFIRTPHTASRVSAPPSAQPIDLWLGVADPIRSWTEKVLVTHRERFSPPEEISADQLEVYAPDIVRQQRGSGFWHPASQIHRPLPGPRLCRPLPGFARAWAKPHYLGLFDYKGAELVLRQTALLEFETSRRLQFGFDQLLQVPRSVPLRIGAETCTLDLRFALPMPEARILSLGWQHRPVRPQTRHLWTFHAAAAPFVCHVLRRLGISSTIMQRTN
jgi:hypothetical protein